MKRNYTQKGGPFSVSQLPINCFLVVVVSSHRARVNEGGDALACAFPFKLIKPLPLSLPPEHSTRSRTERPKSHLESRDLRGANVCRSVNHKTTVSATLCTRRSVRSFVRPVHPSVAYDEQLTK
jgi:hypothetical protein